MKKLNLNVFFVALLAIAALSSCMNLEKILPKNTGTWEVVTDRTATYEDETLVSDSTTTYSGEVTYQFNEDGSGVFTEDGQTTNFTWSHNEEAEQLTITEDGLAIVLDVLSYTRDTMTLFYTFDFDFFGVVFKTETTLNLKRVE